MKRIALLILTSLSLLSLSAQDYYDTHGQDLEFVYIAHDEHTPVSTIIETIQMLYEDAQNWPDTRAVIFYMPNGTRPKIIEVNTPNDNQQDFYLLLDELQTKRSHDVRPDVDVEKITEIINNTDIIDENGQPLYRSVTWNYYINSTFWLLKNNEYVIAALYWVLDMQPLVESGYLRINIFHSKQYDDVNFNHELPFGSKNLCRSMRFLPIPF